MHDLSCQFGTKGFTKQMRQIAGGSKAGLRKFLQQYPSLFVIQNDTVQVANIPPRSKTVSGLDRSSDGEELRDSFINSFPERAKRLVDSRRLRAEGNGVFQRAH